MQIKLDPAFQPKTEANDEVPMSHQPSQHQQAAASGISGSPPADYNIDVAEATEEAGGETSHPEAANPTGKGAKHLNHSLMPERNNHGPDGRPISAGDAATAAAHPTTAGGTTAADLQEGEAGESTPDLAGSSRVPAGHMDHGLPAEGLRMHTDTGVTEGVTEAVTGTAVSGRAAPNAANASQALNKKVLPFPLLCVHPLALRLRCTSRS